MNPPSNKTALLREVELSRSAIRRDFNGLREELNLAKKVEKVIRKKPFWWLAGAGISGFVIASLRGGRPSAKTPGRAAEKSAGKSERSSLEQGVKALGFWGFVLSLFKIAFPVVRPLLSAYATRRMAELAMSLGPK